jgi:hypothetical protein
MATMGSWLILIDSDKAVTQEGIVSALRNLEGATVSESGSGASVEFKGCTIGVAYNEDPSVLAASKDIAERFGKAHRDRARIARAARRFEITYDWDQVPVIRDVLVYVESELSVLVEQDGGKTFAWNPQTEELF